MEFVLIFVALPIFLFVMFGLLIVAVWMFSIAMCAFYMALEWQHWIPGVIGLVVGITGLGMFIFLLSFVISAVSGAMRLFS